MMARRLFLLGFAAALLTALGCSSSGGDGGTPSPAIVCVDGGAALANAWNSCSPDTRYNAFADLDPLSTPPGACVDALDFHQFMIAFGHSCPVGTL